MKHIKCVSCGSSITKSARADPYVCRTCEHGIELERYHWLDAG